MPFIVQKTLFDIHLIVIYGVGVGRGKHPAGFKVIFDNMWDLYFSKYV